MSDGPRPGLRVLAERRGIWIGTCVSVPALRGDPRYAETLAREFNVITPEDALKFGVLCPVRGTYDFSGADAVVQFAEAHRMEVRGHVLVWYAQLPGWLVGGQHGRSELVDILTEHITTVVARYAGRIRVWDVVNEAIDDDGSLRETVWQRTIGPEYVHLAFRAARAADPSALLFYNDYGIEASSRHANAVFEVLRGLRSQYTPVDGVGLQMHLQLGQLADTEQLEASLARLGELGLRIHITEFDVRMPLDGPPSSEQLAQQAEVYRRVLQACLRTPRCEAFVLWGFTDRHSWIPHFFTGHGAALIMDEEYRPKPGYQALAEEMGCECGAGVRTAAEWTRRT